VNDSIQISVWSEYKNIESVSELMTAFKCPFGVHTGTLKDARGSWKKEKGNRGSSYTDVDLNQLQI
jgi:hypothetical protein